MKEFEECSVNAFCFKTIKTYSSLQHWVHFSSPKASLHFVLCMDVLTSGAIALNVKKKKTNKNKGHITLFRTFVKIR